jgi:hypothetical protein
VALLAAIGAIAGAGIGFGWMPALLMVPYAATFVTPVSTGTDAVIYGAIAAIATGYGIILARRFGAPGVVEGDRRPAPVAALVAVGLASSWVPAQQLVWPWVGPSPTGFPNRCSSWCSISSSVSETG